MGMCYGVHFQDKIEEGSQREGQGGIDRFEAQSAVQHGTDTLGASTHGKLLQSIHGVRHKQDGYQLDQDNLLVNWRARNCGTLIYEGSKAPIEEYHAYSPSRTPSSALRAVAAPALCLEPCRTDNPRANAVKRSNSLISVVDLAEWWLKASAIDSSGCPRVSGMKSTTIIRVTTTQPQKRKCMPKEEEFRREWGM
ncbi:hypothetical protein ACJ73_02848 [Blastomyces percursus]|uniref:Uncharacterized protein n=1 Tax=Blastomyces percursus TaxID=1658174 RepID=A0A1J9QCF3_9EURO|nr:hypothetical protein ACJ73_02848 [Blastomyces percursus]